MGVALEKDLGRAEGRSTEGHQPAQEQTDYWGWRCFEAVVNPEMDMGSDPNYYAPVANGVSSSLRCEMHHSQCCSPDGGHMWMREGYLAHSCNSSFRRQT